MSSPIISAFVIVVLLIAGPATAADPDRLWRIVHARCVADQLNHGAPAPCAEVALADGQERGYAVLKDKVGIAQFLLIPTRRLSGIESRELLEPGAPNYWQAAWQERRRVEAALGRALPRDAIELAVNSVASRSQNQLHIHVDCLAGDVRNALRHNEAAINAHWSDAPLMLRGHPYRAMRIEGDEFADTDPFRLLADGISGAAATMGERTLVAAGAIFADGKPGFYLLSDRIDAVVQDAAGGEELLDHACVVAQ